MEAVFRDKLTGTTVSHEVSETATAAELLHVACALFGREELDSVLEVDGVAVCIGVVGGVSGGDTSIGTLGVHSDSRFVLCRSRDRVLAAVATWDSEDWSTYRTADSLPVWAWNDETVVLEAIAADVDAFQFASERLRTTDSFVRDAVARHSLALRYGSGELQDDRELVLAAAKQFTWPLDNLLAHVSRRLKADKEVVLTAVAHGHTLLHASETLRSNKNVVLAAVAVNSGALGYASASLQADKEVVLAAVARCGHALDDASESLRADKEVVLAAVTQRGDSLQFTCESLKADKEVVLAAVAQRGDALEFASESLKADKEVVLAAVAQRGDALEFASESLKGDKEVVLAAVARDGWSLKWASDSLKADKKIVRAAR